MSVCTQINIPITNNFLQLICPYICIIIHDDKGEGYAVAIVYSYNIILYNYLYIKMLNITLYYHLLFFKEEFLTIMALGRCKRFSLHCVLVGRAIIVVNPVTRRLYKIYGTTLGIELN